MILAIYSKYKEKDKWLLNAVTGSMEDAKRFSDKIINRAKRMGYENPEAIVQGYDTVDNVPKVLEIVKPEKQCYN